MAWQTPKTDWSAADGVRDADLNRIEGNISELYNTSKMRNALTIYVAPASADVGGGTAGNDETGNGTSAAPYATIGKALSVIPKNLNEQTVTINVAAGTYNEDVVVKDFVGCINISGVYDRVVTINSLKIEACICLMSNISIRATNGISVTNGATLISNSKLTVVGGTDGVSISRGSTCIVNAALSVSGISGAGVYATSASRVYLLSFIVSNAIVALEAQQGSIIAYGATNMTVTATAFVTRTGGRIYTGAQATLPSAN